VVSRNPACKTALNCVAKTIRRMTRRNVLERWGTKVGTCEVTPQVPWSYANSLMKRDGPKTPTAIRGPLRVPYDPEEKAKAIAD
jgi:hypothetical protein